MFCLYIFLYSRDERVGHFDLELGTAFNYHYVMGLKKFFSICSVLVVAFASIFLHFNFFSASIVS